MDDNSASSDINAKVVMRLLLFIAVDICILYCMIYWAYECDFLAPGSGVDSNNNYCNNNNNIKKNKHHFNGHIYINLQQQ